MKKWKKMKGKRKTSMRPEKREEEERKRKRGRNFKTKKPYNLLCRERWGASGSPKKENRKKRPK